MTEYPTALGASSLDRITLLGQDLAEDGSAQIRRNSVLKA